MPDMPISKPLFLQIFFDGNILSQPSPQKYLTITSFANRLYYLNLFLWNKES